MSRNTVRAPRWPLILLLGVGFAGLGTGCASGRLTAVERARRITSDLRDGTRIMQGLNDHPDLGNPERADRLVATMKKAEAKFRGAVKLDPTSSRPRVALANCLHVIGLTYRTESLWLDETRARYSGTPPKSLVTRSQKSVENYRRYLEESNREYRFYVRNLMQSFPNPQIYEYMQAAYELLEDWENAAQAGRAYANEAGLKGEFLARQMERVRLNEANALEKVGAEDDAEKSP